MKENFDHCLEMLLEHEGGYVNHPSDPGGQTNLGVTKRVWEDWGGTKDMKELTPEDVAPLYKKLYWDKIKGDELPSGVDWCVFDWGVNSGTSRSAKALQRIVGTRDDGHIGPKTMELVMEADVHEIINKMYQERQEFYEKLKTFDTFGKGWTRRNKGTLAQSLEMV